jgi:exodeoxyribonuclease III
MKVATFNVNGVNARLHQVLDWLKHDQPDIACLQELKTPTETFPWLAFREAGYEASWHGQKSWNGVAILSRGQTITERRRALPGDPGDEHSRYLEAEIGGLIVACLYLPNGNPAPGPKFDYKLRWVARLVLHARDLLALKRPVVLAGDFSIIPTDVDVYAPERWREDALFRPEVKGAYALLLSDGWSDALRALFSDERIYTFWKYWRGAFERDAGLRIDHILLSPALRTRLAAGGVDRHMRSRDRPSDHAPVWIELSGSSVRRRPRVRAGGRRGNT